MNVTARISREMEFHLTGEGIPYTPATGPSYSSGGEPAEGGYCEDIAIEEVTISVRDPSKDVKDPETGELKKMGWKDVSILDDVDTENPQVQRLLSNILTIIEDDAQEALSQNAADDEPDYDPHEED